MSHVFISFCPEDDSHVQQICQMLEQANLPYLRDTQIENGRVWRGEIETMLQSAFAVLVVISRHAVTSPIVTYEWATALAHKIPIVPVLIEDVHYTTIHGRLRQVQLLDCRHEIPAQVVQMVAEHYKIAPETSHLTRLVFQAVMPLRLLTRTALWIYPYIRAQVIPDAIFRALVQRAEYETQLVYGQTLLKYIEQPEPGFTTEQIDHAQKFIEKTRPFFIGLGDLDVLAIYEEQVADLAGIVEIAEHYRIKTIEPLIHKLGFGDDLYEPFDHYLKAISSGQRLAPDSPALQTLLPNTRRLIHRYFDEGDAGFILNAIELVRDCVAQPVRRQTRRNGTKQ